METLEFNNPRADASPQVLLNALSGNCSISGNSYLEDAKRFYQPILDWINKYTYEQRGALTWDIKLNYFNSSSKKSLAILLKKLYKYQLQGGVVEVNWYCPLDDDELVEEIDHLMDISRVKINVLMFKR
ncbi:MAG TPA: hypothetical protein DCS93_31990 [Microscillaceae bacterium]|nr:hypothetical protein [Microscillaceae bacterium]